MKFFLSIVLNILLCQILIGQVEPKIDYDQTTGNFLVEYQGDTSIVSIVFEPSTKIEPTINSIVLNNNSLFIYKYSVTNNSNSQQRLEDFDLEVFSNILEEISPNIYWKYSKYSFVPVVGWYNSKGEAGLNHPQNGIPPDSSVSGFIIHSFGLPTIVKSYFRGKPSTNLSFPDEPPSEVEQLLESFIKFPNNTVQRHTIGPKDPPNPFIHNEFIDTLVKYVNNSLSLNWIKDQSTYNKYSDLLSNAKASLQHWDLLIARTFLQRVILETDADSSSTISSEAYALLRYNTEYLLSKLPEPGLKVKLVNSFGDLLPGGSLQYYEGGWKNAIDNGDGTFTVDTKLKTVSLRMTYAYGTQTKNNVTVGADTVVFQTVNTQVKLKDSRDNSIDEGTVQYYADGWRSFGTTRGGIANKELLAGNYSFRMTYAFASNDKQQNLNDSTTVVFQTVNTAVELRNSQNNLINENGTVQYYSGGWRTFGTLENGVVNKELLPNNYSFRMTYAFASNDKQQNLNDSTTVVFQTVNTAVELRNSQNNLINENGTVQYYSGGWRSFGATENGIVSKELLPNNYSFRITYAYASNDKQQNISTNPTVVFQTVNTTVELRDSQNNLIEQGGEVQYYSGGWRVFGSIENGIVRKELLPNNYSFRMFYAFASIDKQQNLNENTTIVFQTVRTTVVLRNSLGVLLEEPGTVQYYSGGWRNFGVTENGIASRELLPNNYSFRMTHGYITNDKSQNIGTDNTVTFSTVLCTILTMNNQNQPIDGVRTSYYSGGWRQIGITFNGEITKELLPANLTFRANYGTIQQDKTQNLLTSNRVEFILNMGE